MAVKPNSKVDEQSQTQCEVRITRAAVTDPAYVFGKSVMCRPVILETRIATGLHDLLFAGEVRLDVIDQLVEDFTQVDCLRPRSQVFVQPVDEANDGLVIGVELLHPDAHRLGPIV